MIDYDQTLLAVVTPADKVVIKRIDGLAIVLVEINKHINSQVFFIAYRYVMVFCDKRHRDRQIL